MYQKCSCDNELFVELIPFKVEEANYRTWSTASLKKDVVTSPILMCVACGKLHVVPTTFPGRNNLDPEVAAYIELTKAVETFNRYHKH